MLISYTGDAIRDFAIPASLEIAGFSGQFVASNWSALFSGAGLDLVDSSVLQPSQVFWSGSTVAGTTADDNCADWSVGDDSCTNGAYGNNNTLSLAPGACNRYKNLICTCHNGTYLRTAVPSKSPTKSPHTSRPSTSPHRKPSASPSHDPTHRPTRLPTTASPTVPAPTRSPTLHPAAYPLSLLLFGANPNYGGSIQGNFAAVNSYTGQPSFSPITINSVCTQQIPGNFVLYRPNCTYVICTTGSPVTANIQQGTGFPSIASLPVQRYDGGQVADSWTDLLASGMTNPIGNNNDPAGGNLEYIFWSGCNANGTPSTTNCGSFTSTSGNGLTGSTDGTAPIFLDTGSTIACSSYQELLCACIGYFPPTMSPV
jgi:hypothetical protein